MATKTHHRDGNEQVMIVLDGQGKGMTGSLAKTIQEELMAVGTVVDDNLQALFDSVGKEAVQKLRETSPVNEQGKHSGRYRKGWVYESGKRTKNHKASGVVRNKTDPQLTHLLEYGHPIVRNGKVVGNSPEIEHIRPVADWVANEIESRMNELL